MASAQVIQQYVTAFWQSWNSGTKRDRLAYDTAVNAAAAAAGLAPGTVPPNSIPTFAQLSGGSGSRDSGGSASTGALVKNAQQAQAPRANPTNPLLLLAGVTAGAAVASRVLTPPNQDGGGAAALPTAATQPGTQTQAVPPGTANQGQPLRPSPVAAAVVSGTTAPPPSAAVADRDSSRYSPGSRPGSFQQDDAAANNPEQNTDINRQRINNLYGQSNLINNQTNVLSRYVNTTYQLSWYISPVGALNSLNTLERSLNNYYLLAQTGGMPGISTAAATTNVVDATGGQETAMSNLVQAADRNPFFDLDFYIDSLEVVTKFPLAGTRMSHTVSEIVFTVVEPYGLSLIPRLQSAIEDVYKLNGIFTAAGARYSSALYVMAIKFWGVKEDGTIERVATTRADGSRIANVEKYIPFVIRDLRWTQSNKQIEYRITGNSPFTFVGFGQERGIALERYNLTGRTVKDVLSSTNTAGQTSSTEVNPSVFAGGGI